MSGPGGPKQAASRSGVSSARGSNRGPIPAFAATARRAGFGLERRDAGADRRRDLRRERADDAQADDEHVFPGFVPRRPHRVEAEGRQVAKRCGPRINAARQLDEGDEVLRVRLTGEG